MSWWNGKKSAVMKTNRKNVISVALCVVLYSLSFPCRAQIALSPNKNTIEMGSNIDFVNNDFGKWYTEKIKYLRRAGKCSYYVELNYMYREKMGGSAFVPVAGAYVDWTKWLYTFTSASVGTETEYSPLFRINNDICFKLGGKKQFVTVVGADYIDFHTEQSIAIVSTGLYYYGTGVVLSYRLFLNTCFPGFKKSFTHLASVDQGHRGEYMNTFTVSYGNQAYQTSYVDINRRAWYALYKHQNWIGEKGWGVYGQIGFSSVSHAYNILNTSFGIIKDF